MLFAVHPVHTEAVAGIVGKYHIFRALLVYFNSTTHTPTVPTDSMKQNYSREASSRSSINAPVLMKLEGFLIRSQIPVKPFSPILNYTF